MNYSVLFFDVAGVYIWIVAGWDAWHRFVPSGKRRRQKRVVKSIARKYGMTELQIRAALDAAEATYEQRIFEMATREAGDDQV